MRDSTFPTGRNPWLDFYRENDLDSISKILRIEKKQIPVERLRQVAERYVLEQEETDFVSKANPKGITYRMRSRSLKGIAGEAAALAEKLTFENRAFSFFPNFEKADFGPRPSFALLVRELNDLESWIKAFANAIDSLGQERGAASKPIHDLKYALVWDLLLIFVLIPDEFGGERFPTIITDKGYGPRGPFVEFVRTTASPILGRSLNLTDEMRVAISKYKKLKPKAAIKIS